MTVIQVEHSKNICNKKEYLPIRSLSFLNVVNTKEVRLEIAVITTRGRNNEAVIIIGSLFTGI